MGLKKEFFCKGEPPSEMTFSDPWSLVKTAVDNLSSFFVQKHINMRKTGLTSRKICIFTSAAQYNQTIRVNKKSTTKPCNGQSQSCGCRASTEISRSELSELPLPHSGCFLQNLFKIFSTRTTKTTLKK